MHEKAGIGEGFWFMAMMVSAAAMDSENPAIPGSICILSALMLLWISRKKSLWPQAQKLGINIYFVSVLIIARREREKQYNTSHEIKSRRIENGSNENKQIGD